LQGTSLNETSADGFLYTCITQARHVLALSMLIYRCL